MGTSGSLICIADNTLALELIPIGAESSAKGPVLLSVALPLSNDNKLGLWRSTKAVCVALLQACAGGVGYYLFGWAFAYGDKTVCDADGNCRLSANPFIGSSQFALSGLPETSYHTFFFQFTVSVFSYMHGAGGTYHVVET